MKELKPYRKEVEAFVKKRNLGSASLQLENVVEYDKLILQGVRKFFIADPGSTAEQRIDKLLILDTHWVNIL